MQFCQNMLRQTGWDLPYTVSFRVLVSLAAPRVMIQFSGRSASLLGADILVERQADIMKDSLPGSGMLDSCLASFI